MSTDSFYIVHLEFPKGTRQRHSQAARQTWSKEPSWHCAPTVCPAFALTVCPFACCVSHVRACCVLLVRADCVPRVRALHCGSYPLHLVEHHKPSLWKPSISSYPSLETWTFLPMKSRFLIYCWSRLKIQSHFSSWRNIENRSRNNYRKIKD